MNRLSYSALAISLALAAPAMAQQAPTTAPAQPAQPAPAAQAVPTTGAPATDARSAGADAAAVTSGMPVRDNTGAVIGSVSSVQAGPNGDKTATIKMGAKTFSVATNALMVNGGAVTVNASQSQIEGMLPK
jgi:hypothetical protein